MSDLTPQELMSTVYPQLHQWITKKDCVQAAELIERRELDHARVCWQISERIISEKEIPASSFTKTPEQPHILSSYDPWQINPETLPNETRQTIQCSVCSGTKKMTCPDCKGSQAVKCPECRGACYVPGKRSGTKKCPTCKAKGTRKCICSKGMVICRPCQGSGLIEHWFEVQEKTFEIAKEMNPGKHNLDWPPFTHVHKANPTLPFDVLLIWHGSPLKEVPPEVEKWIHEPLLQAPLDTATQRAIRGELQVVRVTQYALRYQLAGKKGVLFINKKGLVLDRQQSDLSPFRRRLMIICFTALLIFILGLIQTNRYTERHPFFAASPQASLLWILTWATALLSAPIMSRLALPLQSPGRVHLKKGGIALGVCVSLQVVFGMTDNPTVSHAKYLFEQNKEVAGFQELDACIKTNIQRSEAQALFDDAHLKKAHSKKTLATALPYIRFPFYNAPSRSQVRAHIASIAEAEMKPLLAQRDFKKTEALLATVPVDLIQESPTLKTMSVQILEGLGNESLAAKDSIAMAGIVQKLSYYQAPQNRINRYANRAQKTITEPIQARWNNALNAPTYVVREKQCGEINQRINNALAHKNIFKAVPASFIAYKTRCSQWKSEESNRQKQIAQAIAARKAQEAEWERQRKEEAERVRQEEEQRQSMRAMHPNGVLMCNDGSQSPTCSCPGWRGCCSHHGGISGCKYY